MLLKNLEAASKTHISGLATKARRHKVLKLNWLNFVPLCLSGKNL